jgi:hypothetical protein
MGRVSIVALSAILAALIPVLLTVGAGIYSSVHECNQDASNLEQQLTSILLEIEARETRIKSLLDVDTDKVAKDEKAYNNFVVTLVEIENGDHYGDPAFKDYTLVSLVRQYNRLLRRIQFSADIPQKFSDGLRGIDTQSLHPKIQALDITKVDPHVFASNIDGDLNLIQIQEQWHKEYGPVRRCSIFTLLMGTEPWAIMRLVPRKAG